MALKRRVLKTQIAPNKEVAAKCLEEMQKDTSLIYGYIMEFPTDVECSVVGIYNHGNFIGDQNKEIWVIA